MALTMRKRTFRPAPIAAVLSDPRPGVILDLGCGTGTLAGQLAEACPSESRYASPALLPYAGKVRAEPTAIEARP